MHHPRPGHILLLSLKARGEWRPDSKRQQKSPQMALPNPPDEDSALPQMTELPR